MGIMYDYVCKGISIVLDTCLESIKWVGPVNHPWRFRARWNLFCVSVTQSDSQPMLGPAGIFTDDKGCAFLLRKAGLFLACYHGTELAGVTESQLPLSSCLGRWSCCFLSCCCFLWAGQSRHTLKTTRYRTRGASRVTRYSERAGHSK